MVVPDPNAELQKHIHEWMQLHREEGTCFLQNMVRIPSTQGNEKEAQLLIADKLREMRLDVEVWEPDGEALEIASLFLVPLETGLRAVPM